MTLVIPRTGVRPGPKWKAKTVHLRIPHGLNREFTRTMESAFSEAGLLTVLQAVRSAMLQKTLRPHSTSGRPRMQAIQAVAHYRKALLYAK